MLNTKLPLGYGYAISSKGTVITFIISTALFFFFFSSEVPTKLNSTISGHLSGATSALQRCEHCTCGKHLQNYWVL